MERRSAADDAAFVQTLAEFKRRGCSLLLVGTAGPGLHPVGCERLLGSDDPSPRHRVFVRTDGSCQHDAGVTTNRAPDRTRTIVYEPDVRGSAVRSAPSEAAFQTPTPGAGTGNVPDRHRSVSTLPAALSDALSSFEERGGDLEPGSVRVCIDSLSPLVEEYDRATVFRLLHLLLARVDSVDGIAHVHLPLPRDHEVVATFEALFDAVVELESRGGRVGQRWYVRDRKLSSPWIPLDDRS